jgi:four helix bundle protein
MFDMEHNKLDAYNLALDFAVRAHAIANELPRGCGDLADQLRRASTSIALNIAEGAGEFAAKDKAKFYRYAKRSTAECGAILELAIRLDPGLDDEPRKQLDRIFGALTNLVKRCE